MSRQTLRKSRLTGWPHLWHRAILVSYRCLVDLPTRRRSAIDVATGSKLDNSHLGGVCREDVVGRLTTWHYYCWSRNTSVLKNYVRAGREALASPHGSLGVNGTIPSVFIPWQYLYSKPKQPQIQAAKKSRLGQDTEAPRAN